MQSTIRYEDKKIQIEPIWAMGGGTEGYILKTSTNERFVIGIPYGESPEEEWELLSPEGRAEIRLTGWLVGNERTAIAYAIKLLTQDHSDRESLKIELQSSIHFLRENSDQLYKELVTLGDSAYTRENTKRVTAELEEIADLFEIIEVIRDYDEIMEELNSWHDWPLPETND